MTTAYGVSLNFSITRHWNFTHRTPHVVKTYVQFMRISLTLTGKRSSSNRVNVMKVKTYVRSNVTCKIQRRKTLLIKTWKWKSELIYCVKKGPGLIQWVHWLEEGLDRQVFTVWLPAVATDSSVLLFASGSVLATAQPPIRPLPPGLRRPEREHSLAPGLRKYGVAPSWPPIPPWRLQKQLCLYLNREIFEKHLLLLLMPSLFWFLFIMYTACW